MVYSFYYEEETVTTLPYTIFKIFQQLKFDIKTCQCDPMWGQNVGLTHLLLYKLIQLLGTAQDTISFISKSFAIVMLSFVQS
jgi:hypothetical protein